MSVPPCDHHYILPPPYSPIPFHVIPKCTSSLLSSFPCTTPSLLVPLTSMAPSTGMTSALVHDPSRFTTCLTPPRLSAKVILNDAHQSANIRSDGHFVMYLFFPTPMSRSLYIPRPDIDPGTFILTVLSHEFDQVHIPVPPFEHAQCASSFEW